MPSVLSIVSGAVLLSLQGLPAAHSQEAGREDLSACSGSSAEPGQSGDWKVAFCNRTGHDLVIEFRDNDCPAQNWGRRGDVYRKGLKRGEAKVFPLCYAGEPRQSPDPKPGTPLLRIAGGKGVVTTWSVVGDCADRSDRLNLDGRTFYDRGDYKTGIILLQYPSSAAHCVADVSGGAPAATPPYPAAASPPVTSVARVNTQPAVAGPAAATMDSEPVALTNTLPVLSAIVDPSDHIGRSVQVFAANPKGQRTYRCGLALVLGFTDGGSFTDKVQADVPSTAGDVLVTTRKYGKTVSKVALSVSKCSNVGIEPHG